MTAPIKRWEKLATKAATDGWGGDAWAVSIADTATLLSRQHAKFVRSVEKVKGVYIQGRAESERERDRSKGKEKRRAALDVTHLQVGVDVCDDLLAALKKEQKP